MAVTERKTQVGVSNALLIYKHIRLQVMFGNKKVLRISTAACQSQIPHSTPQDSCSGGRNRQSCPR